MTLQTNQPPSQPRVIPFSKCGPPCLPPFAIHTSMQHELQFMERKEDTLRQALRRSRWRKTCIEPTAGPSKDTYNTTTPSQGSQLHSGRGKQKRVSKPYRRPEAPSGDRPREPRAPHNPPGASDEASIKKRLHPQASTSTPGASRKASISKAVPIPTGTIPPAPHPLHYVPMCRLICLCRLPQFLL